jgi:hypothetical protein
MASATAKSSVFVRAMRQSVVVFGARGRGRSPETTNAALSFRGAHASRVFCPASRRTAVACSRVPQSHPPACAPSRTSRWRGGAQTTGSNPPAHTRPIGNRRLSYARMITASAPGCHARNGSSSSRRKEAHTSSPQPSTKDPQPPDQSLVTSAATRR